MKIGIKNRFYPDDEQKLIIEDTFNNTRFIKNYFLAQRNKYWSENKGLPKVKRAKSLSSMDEINQLKNLKLSIFSIDNHQALALFEKEKIDWMTINLQQFNSLKVYWLNKGLSSALQQGLRELNDSFKRFYNGQNKYPQFKKKSSTQSCTLTVNNFCKFKLLNKEKFKFQVENYEIKLNKTSKPLKIKFDRNFDITKVSKFTLNRNSVGYYFITFLVDEDLTQLKKNYANLVGKTNQTTAIDVGIRATATILTHSNLDKNLQVISQKKLLGLKRYEKRLAKAQRNLSRKVKGSRNRNKARIKVAKVHQGLVNYRNDFYHKLSCEIIQNSDNIIIKNLNIKGMVKNKKLAKSISLQGWGLFFKMLEYKSVWYGKELVKADRFYPSSKICSFCNHYDKNYGQDLNSKGYSKIPEHWTCTMCQSRHNRDINACYNLINYDETEFNNIKITQNHSKLKTNSTAEKAGTCSTRAKSLGKDSKTESLVDKDLAICEEIISLDPKTVYQ